MVDFLINNKKDLKNTRKSIYSIYGARWFLLWKNVKPTPFNNMRTLKFKAQPTNTFFATVNQMFGGSFQLPTVSLSELPRFDYRALGSRPKLREAAEHLIDGSEQEDL